MSDINNPSAFVAGDVAAALPNVDAMGNQVAAELPEVAQNPSIFTMDYWRGKVAQFQMTVNAIDAAYMELQLAQPLVIDDPQSMAEWQDLSDQYDSKRAVIQGLADTINTINSGLNAMGVTVPQVTSTLGVAPLALAAIAVTAAAGIAGVVYWSRQWAATGAQMFTLWQQRLSIASLPEAEQAQAQAQLAAAVNKFNAAQNAAANSSIFGSIGDSIGSGVKLGLLLLAAYLGWQVYRELEHGH